MLAVCGRTQGRGTLETERMAAVPVCQNPVCGKTLVDTWDQTGGLCCECGLEHELSSGEGRWHPTVDIDREPPKLLPRFSGGSTQLAMIRLGLRALAAVAPAAAEEQAARLFFTPRSKLRRAPMVPGLPALSFRLTVGEHQIAGWSWGRGPSILLVHGWEGYGGQLGHFVSPLVSAGFRAVTFDMPGHGDSSGRELSVFDMARVVRTVAQFCEPTHGAIAHSLGGTAVVFSLLEGLRLARVVLLAPAAEPAHFARLLAGSLGLSPNEADGMVERIERRLGRSLLDLDSSKLVRSLAIPALIVHDPEDREVPFKHGKAIADAWPRARLERATGRGHRRILRDPRTIKEVTGFILDDASTRPTSETEFILPRRVAVVGPLIALS